MWTDLLLVPYDSGHRGVRMGAGPLHLAAAGAAERLGARRTTVLEPRTAWRGEVSTGFELMALTAEHCRDVAERGGVPVVLSGNCGITVGTVAGVSGGRRVGVVWLDAHGDLATPETTTSGFLDGMGLAVLTGRCWRPLAATVPGHRPVPDEDVILLGARDVSAAERDIMAGLAQDLSALDRLAVDAVHLHIDLDVHDPSVAPANGYAVPGGLSAAEVRQVVRTVADRLPIASMGLASYDPSYDQGDRMRDAALDLLAELDR